MTCERDKSFLEVLNKQEALAVGRRGKKADQALSGIGGPATIVAVVLLALGGISADFDRRRAADSEDNRLLVVPMDGPIADMPMGGRKAGLVFFGVFREVG